MSLRFASARLIECLCSALLALVVPPSAVMWAHGREVLIELTSLQPDAASPLWRQYQAKVEYASDHEPVDEALLSLEAVSADGLSRVESPSVTHVPGAIGVYVAQLRYPRFGEWTVSLRATSPGVGGVEVTERIRPGTGVSTAEAPANGRAALTPTLSQRERGSVALSVFSTFDGQDVMNIVVRIGHSVGAATYLGMGAVMLLGLWFKPYLQPSAAWRALEEATFPTAVLSLVVLVISGLYTGYFDAPVRAPGVFNIDALANVPFGFQYATAFATKIALGFGLLALLWRVRRMRQSEPEHQISCAGLGMLRGPGLGAAHWLTVGFGFLTLLLLADVVVLVYLHYISHLGSTLPVR
jgi:hypothetical protein